MSNERRAMVHLPGSIGSLCFGAFEEFGPKEIDPDLEACHVLLARVMHSYGMDWGNFEAWTDEGRQKLQTLVLLLVRDHRPDLFKEKKWTDQRTAELAISVDLNKEHMGGTDSEALSLFRHWNPDIAEPLRRDRETDRDPLEGELQRGRRLLRRRGKRGRPKKIRK